MVNLMTKSSQQKMKELPIPTHLPRSISSVEKPTVLTRKPSPTTTEKKMRSSSQPSCPIGRIPDRKDASSISLGCSLLKDYRVVVLGGGRVGKSSLVRRFLMNTFSQAYTPTIEECYRHIVQLPDGQLQTIEIIDTAGLHQFPAMRELRISTGHAFVIVYAIDNAISFAEAEDLVQLIHNTKGDTDVPIVLVGTKTDRSEYREVETEKAIKLAEKYDCVLQEISCLQCQSVDFLFVDLLAQTLSVNGSGKRSSSLTDDFSRRVSLAIMDSVNRQQELKKLKKYSSHHSKRCTIL